MIMYKKIYCDRCKRYRHFTWQNDDVYMCSMCGIIQRRVL
jgi:hypothetical protein